jgi:hypothetical protein
MKLLVPDLGVAGHARVRDGNPALAAGILANSATAGEASGLQKSGSQPTAISERTMASRWAS